MPRILSGDRLREARTVRDVPIERLALDVHRSASTIVDYERGRVTPPANVLAALADALGCSLDDFYEPERVA